MLLGGNVRRSTRRVKPRGEREFLVNSDMLLRDLKVMVSLDSLRSHQNRRITLSLQIMETFKVAPYDQNLMVNGEYLTENHLTLGQLKVLPSSLIFLRVSGPSLSLKLFSILIFPTIFNINFPCRLMNLPTVLRVPVKIMLGRITPRPASKERDCLVVNISVSCEQFQYSLYTLTFKPMF